MREFTLNMLSHADRVKGQGVLSAYLEELHLITGNLDQIEGNGHRFSDESGGKFCTSGRYYPYFIP